jgi:hypothetical protein
MLAAIPFHHVVAGNAPWRHHGSTLEWSAASVYREEIGKGSGQGRSVVACQPGPKRTRACSRTQAKASDCWVADKAECSISSY